VTAEVGLATNGAGGYRLNVTLRVELPDRIAPEAAQELLHATHQVCPYSNATQGNIPVELVVE
jgi:organic hydroperoxide reductase OsmC/OhrA